MAALVERAVAQEQPVEETFAQVYASPKTYWACMVHARDKALTASRCSGRAPSHPAPQRVVVLLRGADFGAIGTAP